MMKATVKKLSKLTLNRHLTKAINVPYCYSFNLLGIVKVKCYKSCELGPINQHFRGDFLNTNFVTPWFSQVYKYSKYYSGILTCKHNLHTQLLPSSMLETIDHRRNKSTKKSGVRPEYDSDSESDDEDLPQGTKRTTVRLQSLRLDGLIKKALNIARNKVEAAFYQGNIRVNGKKPDKKSFQLRIGDEVDLIRGPSPMNPDYLSVSRIEVVSVEEDGSDDVDQMLVKLKFSKTLYIENYHIQPWKKTSTAE